MAGDSTAGGRGSRQWRARAAGIGGFLGQGGDGLAIGFLAPMAGIVQGGGDRGNRGGDRRRGNSRPRGGDRRYLGQGGGGLAIGFLAPMAGIVQGALKCKMAASIEAAIG